MTIDEAKNILENVWDFAMAENEENADTLEKAIDIAIRTLGNQIKIKEIINLFKNEMYDDEIAELFLKIKELID